MHWPAGSRRPSGRKFFKSLLRGGIGRGVLRPGRQAHIAQLRQQLADRALVHRDAEQGLDLLLEIDAPPAHDTILVRIGAGLDKPGDLRLLLRTEPRLAAFRLAVG